LKTSSEFWMNLQVALDLYEAQHHIEHAAWPARLTDRS
jgi:plasmid maintenance system antidote protein VapI